jgi:membrane protein YqaA with SNARE-associated domain
MDFLSLGYIGLFLGTFLSATLIPFPSEGILIGFLELDFGFFPVIIVATIGNFLGGLTNYIIGYYASSEKMVKKFNLNQRGLAKWRLRLSKWGIWLGLLSWVPFVGDPMVAALGFFKVKLIPLSVMMFFGKLARYIVVAYLYIYSVHL